jgi:hypothetical protein
MFRNALKIPEPVADRHLSPGEGTSQASAGGAQRTEVEMAKKLVQTKAVETVRFDDLVKAQRELAEAAHNFEAAFRQFEGFLSDKGWSALLPRLYALQNALSARAEAAQAALDSYAESELEAASK